MVGKAGRQVVVVEGGGGRGSSGMARKPAMGGLVSLPPKVCRLGAWQVSAPGRKEVPPVPGQEAEMRDEDPEIVSVLMFCRPCLPCCCRLMPVTMLSHTHASRLALLQMLAQPCLSRHGGKGEAQAHSSMQHTEQRSLFSAFSSLSSRCPVHNRASQFDPEDVCKVPFSVQVSNFLTRLHKGSFHMSVRHTHKQYMRGYGM